MPNALDGIGCHVSSNLTLKRYCCSPLLRFSPNEELSAFCIPDTSARSLFAQQNINGLSPLRTSTRAWVPGRMPSLTKVKRSAATASSVCQFVFPCPITVPDSQLPEKLGAAVATWQLANTNSVTSRANHLCIIFFPILYRLVMHSFSTFSSRALRYHCIPLTTTCHIISDYIFLDDPTSRQLSLPQTEALPGLR